MDRDHVDDYVEAVEESPEQMLAAGILAIRIHQITGDLWEELKAARRLRLLVAVSRTLLVPTVWTIGVLDTLSAGVTAFVAGAYVLLEIATHAWSVRHDPVAPTTWWFNRLRRWWSRRLLRWKWTREE